MLSLFWKRTNFAGAVSGIVSGAVAVIVWDYIPMVKSVVDEAESYVTLGSHTGLYSLVIGFALSMFCIVVFSLVTKEPTEEMLKEFEDVKNKEVAM